MKVTCIVNDSSLPGFVSEHGLAFLIETPDGLVLFDTGGSGRALLHNLSLLGQKPEDVSAVVLSHAHRDHTGGLPALLERVPRIPIYAHPDIFRKRFSKRMFRLKEVGLPLTKLALEKKAELRLSSQPTEVVSGVWTTGEITSRPEPEGRSARHFVQSQEGFVPDPYRDDMSVVLGVKEGLVLVCGCCHAGLLNTLAHVRRHFQKPICAIVGGAHLIDADDAHLAKVVETLGRYGPPGLYLNHCTGKKALAALKRAFGDAVRPFPAGAEAVF